MRILVGLVLLASACARPSQIALDYRNKARERFTEGKFGVAVSNYDKAKDNDRKRRLDDLESERQLAATEHMREQMKVAWDMIDQRKYMDAHQQLMSIKAANGFGVKGADKMVERALMDTAALQFAEVEALYGRRHFVKAMLMAEFLLEPLPPNHALREKLKLIKAQGIAHHMSKMRRNKDKYPMSAALHYLIAQRLGGTPDSDGLLLLAELKRQSGDAQSIGRQAQQISELKDRSRYPEIEHLLVQQRAVGTEWSPAAGKFFEEQYGLADDGTMKDKLLVDIWDMRRSFALYDRPDPDKLPEPDEIIASINPDVVEDVGQQPRTMDFAYGAGKHVGGDDLFGTNLSATIRFPSKKTKSMYEISGHLESSSLGGNSSGYGADIMLTKLIKPPVIGAIGIGYSENETTPDMVADPTAVPYVQKSIHIPVLARVPIIEGYAASLEFRANILQFTKDKDMTPGAEQHLSPLTARLYGPIPLLSNAIPFLRNFVLEANVSYVKDAPVETVYGGRLLFRRNISSMGGSSADIKDSVFAIQTLIGPTIDFYYEYSRGFLMKPDNAFGIENTNEAGMGSILRIPSRDASGIDLAFWFHTSGLGGNVGGWGIEYLALKGGGNKTPFVIGYGLGYASDSVSNLPMQDPMNPTSMPSEMKHQSFHTPIVLRFALGASVIAALEGRINYLQLKGSGVATPDCVAMMTCETRHFSPVGARIWIPIPILGDAIDIIKKFHLEGHVTYNIGANESDLYGNRPLTYGFRLVWRPIQSKR